MWSASTCGGIPHCLFYHLPETAHLLQLQHTPVLPLCFGGLHSSHPPWTYWNNDASAVLQDLAWAKWLLVLQHSTAAHCQDLKFIGEEMCFICHCYAGIVSRSKLHIIFKWPVPVIIVLCWWNGILWPSMHFAPRSLGTLLLRGQQVVLQLL